MSTRLLAIIGGVGLLLGALPVRAHHAFAAEFDEKKPLKLKGTVTKWQLTNPHSWIHMDVKGPDGKVIAWQIEGGSPNALFRMGFTKESLPAGSEILVDGFQAKDGSNKAVGKDITFADGKRLFLGGSAPGANGPGSEATK
jgi:hypothetical protein